MKIFILVLLIVCCSLPSSAQRKKPEKYRTRPIEKPIFKSTERKIAQKERQQKRKHNTRLYFSPELTSAYSINRWDIVGLKNGESILHSKSTMAYAVGLGVRLESKKTTAPFIAGFAGFSAVPQRLVFNYAYQPITKQYTNEYLYFKLIVGYNFALSPQHALDFGIGFQNLQCLGGREEEPQLEYTPYVDAQTGESLNQLKSVSVINWGNNNGGLGLLFCPTLQLAYVNKGILGNRRMIRLGVEISSQVKTSTSMYYHNRTKYHEFDANRNLVRTEEFNDLQASIGLNLSIGI